MSKFTYFFSKENTDGNKDMKALLGGKGANLAEMSSIGINVPPGFTISTEACLSFQRDGEISSTIKEQVLSSLGQLENITKKIWEQGIILFLFP